MKMPKILHFFVYLNQRQMDGGIQKVRTDIYEKVSTYKMDKIKPNFSEISRRYNCDPRTVKRYYQGAVSKRKTQKKPSKLDKFKPLINEKLELGVSGIAIYKYILKQGYEGKYTILKDYIRTIKDEKTKKATIRVETSPGLSAQVDWKEDFTLHTKQGEKVTFQLFLMILGYSRFKFIEPTLTKDQKVLFSSMAHGFETFGGVPKEIWFDNMRTVVDRAKTQFTQVVFNQTFYHFSKDMAFHPIACRPYRPQTKGKVEALAKLTERLRVYDYEIDGYEDIFSIVKQFQDEINEEISQATDFAPNDLLLNEKEYLTPLPDKSILYAYQEELIERKVSLEAMITYGKVKYSVSPKYIGKVVRLEILEDILHIYYNQELIRKHKIRIEKYNYHAKDAFDILKSDVFKDKTDEDILTYIEGNINVYDDL